MKISEDKTITKRKEVGWAGGRERKGKERKGGRSKRYLDTRKIGTVRVFSMFFATAFCIPSMATTPSIMGAASFDTAAAFTGVEAAEVTAAGDGFTATAAAAAATGV